MPDRIEDFFADSHTPTPRAELTDRILLAARNQTPLKAANDRAPWTHKGFWAGLTAIAATMVAGLFMMTSQPTEADLWASQADQSGCGDLYEWVYADDDTTQ